MSLHDPEATTDDAASLASTTLSPAPVHNSVTDRLTTNATNDIVDAREELQATLAMCYYCFDVLWHELKQRPAIQSTFQPTAPTDTVHSPSPMRLNDVFDPSAPVVECPLFVTWERSSPARRGGNGHDVFELRGCIGTLTPKALTLSTLKEYALLSALKDRRFDPIAMDELPRLRVAVSLLVQYEDCRDCYDWTVGVHGILIRFSSPSSSTVSSTRRHEFSATFLPEVALQQGWDQTKTVAQLIRKAGYKGLVTDELVQSIDCQRYQSSKQKVTFAEYKQHVSPEWSMSEPHQLARLVPEPDQSSPSDNSPVNNCDIM